MQKRQLVSDFAEGGVDEPIREEYKVMKDDFEFLVGEVTKIVSEYYEQCGRPKSTLISSFVMPKEIIKELGPVLDRAGTNEECMKDI